MLVTNIQWDYKGYDEIILPTDMETMIVRWYNNV